MANPSSTARRLTVPIVALLTVASYFALLTWYIAAHAVVCLPD